MMFDKVFKDRRRAAKRDVQEEPVKVLPPVRSEEEVWRVAREEAQRRAEADRVKAESERRAAAEELVGMLRSTLGVVVSADAVRSEVVVGMPWWHLGHRFMTTYAPKERLVVEALGFLWTTEVDGGRGSPFGGGPEILLYPVLRCRHCGRLAMPTQQVKEPVDLVAVEATREEPHDMLCRPEGDDAREAWSEALDA